MTDMPRPGATASRNAQPHRQLRVALTGGVGSGKSALADALESLGAVRIDADRLARDVVEPGTEGLSAVQARFGDAVIAADGTLDRAALAAIVFADETARDELNAILHPLIARRSQQLMDAVPAGSIVVYEIPLLVENAGADRFDGVITVEAPLELRLERLASRGVSADDATARMAAQASDRKRRAIADEVVVNDGSLADLRVAAEKLWEEFQVWQEAKTDDE